MGDSINVDLRIKRVETIGHVQVGDHLENFDNIPALAQCFTEIVIGLNQMKINGSFLRKNRSFVVALGLT